MANDMKDDIFAGTNYGKAALKKLVPYPDNFRLYSAKLLGRPPMYSDAIEVKGAEFREAKSGANKGKFTILIKGTERAAIVTKSEFEAINSDS